MGDHGQQKNITEFFLGEYTLDQLYMFAGGELYFLDPFSRFMLGGLGVFDLSVQPSFSSTNIFRDLDGIWYIHLNIEQGVRGFQKEPLSASALESAVAELKPLL